MVGALVRFAAAITACAVGAAAFGSAEIPGCDVAGYDDRCEVWSVTAGGAETFVPLASAMHGSVLLTVVEWDGSHRFEAFDVGSGASRWRVPAIAVSGCESYSPLAISPDGATLFVSGLGLGRRCVAALDAGTGSIAWSSVLAWPSTYEVDGGTVAPDGGILYLGGSIDNGASCEPFVAALDATNGSLRWLRGHVLRDCRAGPILTAGVAGGVVMVSRTWPQPDPAVPLDTDLLAVSYRGSDGTVVWDRVWDGGRLTPDAPVDVVVAPDQRTVYVASTIQIGSNHREAAVSSLAVGDGELSWHRRRGGALDLDVDAIALAPGGETVVATGRYSYGPQAEGFVTLTLDGETGDVGWERRLASPIASRGAASDVTTSADGGSVIVTGVLPGIVSDDPLFGLDAVTVAYATSSGDRRWIARKGTPASRNVRLVRIGDRVVAVVNFASETLDLVAATAPGPTLIAYDV